MTTPASVKPLARQLWIRNRCIAVESHFVGRDARAAFALRFLPALAVILFAYFNPFSIPALWLAPFVLAAFAFAIPAMARRYHDLGAKGVALLQVLLPLFVALWIGPKIPDTAHLPLIVYALLCLWPLLSVLRLLFAPSAPAAGDAP